MAQNVKILRHFETPTQAGRYYRLVCLTGKNKGQSYYLMSNRAILGRADKADIRVHDIKSSREHAEIAKAGEDVIITDLQSQNGVFVNDIKIKQHKLNDGDKIIIGKTVYKFGTVSVQAVKEIDEDEDEFEVDEPKKNNGLVLFLVVVIVGALFILADSEEKAETPKDKKTTYKINEVVDPFSESMKRKNNKSKETEEKLNTYFKKGLRELREENYFRALSEFNHALSWSPNDPLAQFYLRKTREALDRKIETYFIRAKRSEEALRYEQAVTSYCSVIRLLYNYPEDERYLSAKTEISNLEGKMGKEKDSIDCSAKPKEE